MADDVERLVLQMSADLRKLETGLDRGHRKFERTANAIERRQAQLDRKLAALGSEIGNFARPAQVGSAVALAAITAFSVKASQRAEAVNGAFKQTFRDMPKEAAAATEGIASEFGRLETDIKDNFTQLRSILTALGVDAAQSLTIVDQLQRRSLDIAAFRDVSDAEAFGAVISGITGETEPLKRFGIIVNETAVKAELLKLGFKGNAQQASEAAKSIARTNIIMRQSAEAQGQVSRESGGLAEQQKRTNAEFTKAAEDFGQQFLPVAKQVLGWASDALKAFNELPSGVQNAGLALLAFVAASGPIGAAISGLRALIGAAIAARAAVAAIGSVPGGGKGGAALTNVLGGAAGGAATRQGISGILGRAATLAGPAGAVAGTLALSGDSQQQRLQGQERINAQIAEEARLTGVINRLRGQGNEAEARRQEQYRQRVRTRRELSQGLQEIARPRTPQETVDQAAKEALAAMGDFGLSDAQKKPASGTDGTGGGSKKGSGPSAAELAAQREMLALQAQAELLRAQGRDADADAAQRQIDIINLTKSLTTAEVKDAAKVATAQVDALANAEAAARGRESAVERTKTILEMVADAQQRNADLAEDELGFRIEIARLLGDEAGVRAAQREYDIVRRTADLKAKGAVDPEGQATRESDKLRGAEILGALGGDFESPVDAKRREVDEINALLQEGVFNEEQAAAARAAANARYDDLRLNQAADFFGALAGLSSSSNKTLAAIGKAAALAQATIAGYVAIQEAWRSAPYPFNLPAVAITTAATAANVASIAGLKDGGIVTGPGGPREDKVLRRLSAGEFVVNASATSQNRALLEAINSGSVRLPSIPGAGSLSIPTSNSLTYSPTIDARGSDMAAVARLEQIMAAERRQFTSRVMGVVGKKARYRLGQNADA